MASEMNEFRLAMVNVTSREFLAGATYEDELAKERVDGNKVEAFADAGSDVTLVTYPKGGREILVGTDSGYAWFSVRADDVSREALLKVAASMGPRRAGLPPSR